MAVAPYRASTEILRPLFEEFLNPSVEGSRMGTLLRAPLADVVESEAEIRVVLEVPGMRSDDLTVDIENNVLTIRGEKREDRREGDQKSTWHLTERRYGKFSRSFVLPRDVDSENVGARFENGILTVSVPKSERAKRRRIEVRTETGRETPAAS